MPTAQKVEELQIDDRQDEVLLIKHTDALLEGKPSDEVITAVIIKEKRPPIRFKGEKK